MNAGPSSKTETVEDLVECSRCHDKFDPDEEWMTYLDGKGNFCESCFEEEGFRCGVKPGEKK
jgi:hypothetical protein